MKNRYFFIILFLAVIVVYGNSLPGCFLWDDNSLIVNNPLIKNLSNFLKVFSFEVHQDTLTNYYRPLVVMSFMADYSIFGLKPVGYHLTNILLHFLAGVFLFLLLDEFVKNRFLSFATSLLFLVHPIHAEVVAYISGRADSLSALFILASILFFIKNYNFKNYFSYIISLVFFIFALLSKETVVIFPVIILGICSFLKIEKKQNLKISPFFIVVLIYAILRFTVLNFSCGNLLLSKKGFALFEIGIFERLFLFGKTFLIYLGSFIAPVHLHMERITIYEKLYPEYWIGVLICFVATCFIVKKFKDMSAEIKKLVLFFIFWFFIWLLPQSAFVFPKTMAEHFLYLPSMALCFFMAFLINMFKDRKTKKIIFITVALYFGLLSWLNNKNWTDELRFFERMAVHSPVSIRACDSLASLYLEKGRYDDAEREYRRMLSLVDRSVEKIKAKMIKASVFYNLGILYDKRGRLEEAIEAYNLAISINPEMEKAYNNIGLLYQRTGDAWKAERSFRKAIELNGRFYQAINNLAQFYAQRGDFKKAVAMWQKALQIKPDYELAKKNIEIALGLMRDKNN